MFQKQNEYLDKLNEPARPRSELDEKLGTTPLIKTPIKSFEDHKVSGESPVVQTPPIHHEYDGGDFKETESEAELVTEKTDTKKNKKHKKKKKSHKKKHKKNKYATLLLFHLEYLLFFCIVSNMYLIQFEELLKFLLTILTSFTGSRFY